MASPPLLDLDALIAPIPGDNPAGIKLPPDRRRKIEDARKEFEPNPDDPAGSPIPKKPDWPGIVRQSTDILTEDSKDLLTAARLTEALTKRHSFAGVRDGLILLRRLLVDCWERMHPLIEDPEDIEMRAGPFEWLNELEGGAFFPGTVRSLPLVRLGKLVVSCTAWNEGRVGDDPISKDSGSRGEPVSPDLAEDVSEALAELTNLEQTLQEKLESNAPSLLNLRAALEECQRLLAHLSGKAGSTVAEGEPNVGLTGGFALPNLAGGMSMPQAGNGKATREEIYRHLEHLAGVLSEVEPHSPIPDLLHWAVALGQMPFRQLIQELVREPTVLSDIRRQFGIKDESSS